MRKTTKRTILICASVCMLSTNYCVTYAETLQGKQEITNTNNPPGAVEGYVWELVDSDICLLIEHQHSDDCYYKTCDHNHGHLPTCYSSATEYTLCEHDDESMHTGSVTLADVVTISGTNVTWKKDHPAYEAVYAVYKEAYDKAYESASFMKEIAAKAAGVAALAGKKFCYTTHESTEPDQCTHTCSAVGGSCYTKICILEEHEHTDDCYKYTWELKLDENKNNVADDKDTYYTVKYVDEENILLEKQILVGMPTPSVAEPSKAADAQYTYTFIGWDKTPTETVNEDVTYTAVYNKTLNIYKVTWQDESGNELEVDEVEYGKIPTYDGELPTKLGDNTISYTFAGWNPTISEVTGDIAYTATYSTKDVFPINYYINDELVKTEYVIDGDLAPEFIPTKEHYSLSKWKYLDTEYDFSQSVTSSIDLKANWILEEAVVTVENDNSNCSDDGIYDVNQEISLYIEPNEGYIVDKITINDENKNFDYFEGGAVIKLNIDDVIPTYTVKVETKKVNLSLKDSTMNIYGDLSTEAIFNKVYDKENSIPNDLTIADVKVEYLAYEIELLGNKYEWWVEPGTDVSLESFLNQYGLGAIASYIPTEVLPHKFSTQAQEKIRVTVPETDRYAYQLTNTATISFLDERIETEIKLNKGIEVTYGANKEEILKLVFNSVVDGENLVTNNVSDVYIEADNLNAGTQTVTVFYNGNDIYKNSSKEVEITINKADSYINISSSIVKYGTNVSVTNAIDSNVSHIDIVLGVSAGDNISADASTVAYVNFPSLINTEQIENETIKNLVERIESKLEENLNKTVTISELRDTLYSLLPYIESIEGTGFDININKNTIESLINVLRKMDETNTVSQLKVKISMNEDILISDTGFYLVAGISSDSNYKQSFDMGYAVVYPDGYRAELDWKIHDENGIITINALKNGYDLDAYVSNVYEGTVEDATAHLKTIYTGIDINGNFIVTENQEDLTFGAYTEIAFLADFGNITYYAEPIIRSFVVTSDIVDVKFIDENGNENNDRIFPYGVDASMHAKAYNRHSGEEINDGTMTYYYSGIQTNGELYSDTIAPTYPGAYSVIAMFKGTDSSAVGSAIGAFIIEQKISDFDLIDKTVEYDGKPHFVDVVDTAGLQHIYVVVDENGNVNIILPDSMNMLNDSLKEKLKEYMASSNYSDLYSEDYMDDIMNEFNENSFEVNGELPTEVGTYQVFALAFGKSDYKAAADNATLTIKEVVIPEDDKTDDNIKDDDKNDNIKDDDKNDNIKDDDKDDNIKDDDTNIDNDKEDNVIPDDSKDDDTDKSEEEFEDVKEPEEEIDNVKPEEPKEELEEFDGPGTGDGTNIDYWIISLIISLMGFVGLVVLNKRDK